MKHPIALLAAVLMSMALISACSLPQTTVRSGSAQQPGLIVKGAPAGSILFVDGLNVGAANDFNGAPQVLSVLEGVHKVEVRQGSTVLYSEKSFVSSGETHTVTVIGGAAQ